MKLILQRYRDDGKRTHGLLWAVGKVEPPLRPIREWICYTLEDTYRREKVKHETRIPHGIYQIKFHPNSRFDFNYKKRFGTMHKGMLHLQDVPGFEGVLIHCGNDEGDTSGCILPGLTADPTMVGKSTGAYKVLYPLVATALGSGEDVQIEILDEPGRFAWS